jgi:hypothetical protein
MIVLAVILIFFPDCSSLIQLRQNIENYIVHVLPELYQATAVTREDMPTNV